MKTFAAWLRRAFTGRNVFYVLCAYCAWAYLHYTDKYPDDPNARETGWMLILLAGFLCARYYERNRRAFGDLPREEQTDSK